MHVRDSIQLRGFLIVLVLGLFIVRFIHENNHKMSSVPKIGPVPAIGLGVYKSTPGATTYEAVLTALKLGYRHFDTAEFYENEADVGRAVKDSGIPREDIWLTTKIWTGRPSNPKGNGYEDAIRGVDGCLKRLGLEYIDLLLLHSPHYERNDRWKGLEKSVEQGKVKYIGVSNFGEKHLKELLAISKIKPLVNQIEVHVFLARKELCDFCAANGILVEAYSPLAKATDMKEPTLHHVAQKHKKTVAQVMLRFLLQRGLIVLPKSVHESRQKENADIFDFELDEDDMKKLWNLDRHQTTG
jgi:diketogulonate reductase-like aldo/keto reductase